MSADRTLATRPQELALAPVARTLQELVPGALVYLDARGNVVSPSRWRFTMGALLALWGSVGLHAMLTAGLAAMAPWVVLSAPLLWVLRSLSRRNRMLRSVMPLIVRGEFEAARRLLEAAPPSGRQQAALWWQLRAELARREGDPEGALRAYRAAIEHLRHAYGPRALGVIERCCRYGVVSALTTLGQVEEAERELRSLEGQPRGDFLEYLHWTAELYLAFTRDAPPPADDALFARARSALELRVGGGLLSLCAWVYLRNGDEDMGLHLLGAALDRMEGEHLDRSAPRLWKWIRSKESAARASWGA